VRHVEHRGVVALRVRAKRVSIQFLSLHMRTCRVLTLLPRFT
jgi:hypothetical protein